MRIVVLTALATVSLLASCGQGEDQANAPAANSTASAEGLKNSVIPAAAPATREEALKIMHDRHEGMEGLGKAMKGLHRALDSSDVSAVQQQTAAMTAVAAKIPGWFPPGTGPDVGKTRAKAEIWQRPDDFAAKTTDYRSTVEAVDAAARSGDLNKVMALHDGLDKACKACHDPYRVPKK